MQNLKVIGTSHISAESVREVHEYIVKYKPDIVALELDHRRMHALLDGKREKPGFEHIRRFGLHGFLFALIGGWAQQKLGKITGIEPGTEMREAFFEAKKHNLKVALIDQDFEITLRRFSKGLTWREKFRIIADLFYGLFAGKRQMERMGINFDLDKVPEKKVVKAIMKYMKKRYPNIHRVLVEERNNVMAANLFRIMNENPNKKILAVVGAGHEEELERLTGKITENTAAGFSYTVSV